MKRTQGITFIALAGMFFAILTIFQVDFYVVLPAIPWYLVTGGSRLVLAGLLSWGLTVILFHFKS
jgi:hypothetical protein